MEEYLSVSEKIDFSPNIKKKMIPPVSTENTPIQVQEERARLSKSNYTLSEWRESVDEEEKGLIIALYDYENMLDYVTRYYSYFESERERELSSASKGNK